VCALITITYLFRGSLVHHTGTGTAAAAETVKPAASFPASTFLEGADDEVEERPVITGDVVAAPAGADAWKYEYVTSKVLSARRRSFVCLFAKVPSVAVLLVGVDNA
jgi:hypothetical protein